MYAYLLPFQHDINIILLPYKKTSPKKSKNILLSMAKISKNDENSSARCGISLIKHRTPYTIHHTQYTVLILDVYTTPNLLYLTSLVEHSQGLRKHCMTLNSGSMPHSPSHKP